MNAILIHPDGRAEVVFGDFQGDLTKMAVLTQAAVSALEEAGSCDAVQSRMRQDGSPCSNSREPFGCACSMNPT